MMLINKLCDRSLLSTHSRGIVVYTVTSPAIAPIPKVMLLGSVCPGGALLCTSCLSVVYVVNRTAEFAPIYRVVYECESR